MLTAAVLPEDYDGAGLGLVELCRVLVEVGRTVAPVPLAAHGPASRLNLAEGIRLACQSLPVTDVVRATYH